MKIEHSNILKPINTSHRFMSPAAFCQEQKSADIDTMKNELKFGQGDGTVRLMVKESVLLSFSGSIK